MEAFRHYLTLPFLLEGMALTLGSLSPPWRAASSSASLVALMRLSSYRVLSGAAWLYVWLLRGTPVLLQLVFLFDALPLVGIVMPPVTTAILGFALNEAAFSGEVIRGGILSVSRNQTLAAASLGMGALLTLRRIVLPQAMRAHPACHRQQRDQRAQGNLAGLGHRGERAHPPEPADRRAELQVLPGLRGGGPDVPDGDHADLGNPVRARATGQPGRRAAPTEPSDRPWAVSLASTSDRRPRPIPPVMTGVAVARARFRRRCAARRPGGAGRIPGGAERAGRRRTVHLVRGRVQGVRPPRHPAGRRPDGEAGRGGDVDGAERLGKSTLLRLIAHLEPLDRERSPWVASTWATRGSTASCGRRVMSRASGRAPASAWSSSSSISSST